MSVKDIKNLSMREICEKVGFSIEPSQIMFVIKNEEEARKIDEKSFSFEGIKQFMEENPEKIDKEKYLFATMVNCREQLERMSKLENPIQKRKFVMQQFGDDEAFSEFLKNSKKDFVEFAQKDMSKKYQIAKKLLQGSHIEMPVLAIRGGKAVIEDFLTMKNELYLVKPEDKEKNFQNEENLKVLQELDKQGLLDRIISFSSNSDYSDFLCSYPGNGRYFFDVIQYNSKEEYQKIMKAKEGDALNKAVICEIYGKEHKELLEKYCGKFDIERFLLVSAYRAKATLGTYSDLEEEEMQDLVKIMRFASEHISNKRIKFSGNVYLGSIQEKPRIEYSYKNLQDDLSRVFNNTYYFSKEELIFMRKALLQGDYDIQNVKYMKGLFEKLNFDKKEKMKLVELNPSNFDVLLSLEGLNEEEIHEILPGLSDYKMNQMHLVCLYDQGLIAGNDALQMYMKTQIDLPQMLDLSGEFENVKQEVTVEKLMNYYVNREEDSEKERDFERYALLFRELHIKEKSSEEQLQIADEIMEELYKTESDYEVDLKNLYKDSLLPIQTLIDWNGEQMIYDLIKNHSLKPKDARELLMTGTLNLDKTYQALVVSNLSDEEKLNFIFSSFNGAGENIEEIKRQNEARMYLIQAIHVTNDKTDIKGSGTRTKRGQKGSVAGNQYVTDPVYRWQLFSELDENCEIDLYLDGTAKVLLPNLNKVIIEKMFKSTKTGTKINYGAATYVMSQETFYEHKEKIEENGKVNRKELIEMQKKEEADKFVHSLSWGRALKANLEVSQENGYQPEKIERIDQLINRIEKARELVD